MKLHTNAGVGPRGVGRRATMIGCASAVALGASLTMISPAVAQHKKVHCGDVITHDTKLNRPLGPCSGNGLVVRGKGVTLNLGGYSIRAANGPEETVGILLDGAKRAVVKNGTVRGFDAGVNVDGGSRNTVKGIIARNNINDNVAPADPDNPTPEEECNFGDGITVTDSDDNSIRHNHVRGNGPYSGISLVGDSDENTVKKNTVANNNVPNEDAAPGDQGNGFCGAHFSRPIQDIGIRVEGPGANGNQVIKNDVRNSAIGGITIHGYVYNPQAPPGMPTPPPDNPNTDNVVRGNYVADTGKETVARDPLADGIGVLRQGPAAVVGVSEDNAIVNNTVVRSMRHGIFLGRQTQPGPLDGNTVSRNDVSGSLLDGIFVQGPRPPTPTQPAAPGSVNNDITRNRAHGNGEHDGHDGNADCDNNVWFENVFDWVNQSCVSATAGVRPPL